MAPLVTYQFHKVTDSDGMLHVVKDSLIAQCEWQQNEPVGHIVMVNGQVISMKQADLNQAIAQFTFPKVPTPGPHFHLLNKDQIVSIDWFANAPDGTINLTNGNNVVLGINELIQVITVLTETINP
jgi:uncharacterized protein YlzI (FlbEa/FlbD family)